MFRIDEPTFQALPYDLDKAIEKYKADLEEHKTTVDVPAPLTYQLVETIVKRHGGLYEVVAPVECVRIVDGVVMDKKKFFDGSYPADWEPVTREDQKIGHEWDEDKQAFVKRQIGPSPDTVKEAALHERLAAIESTLKLMEPVLAVLQTTVDDMRSRDAILRQREALVASREALAAASVETVTG